MISVCMTSDFFLEEADEWRGEAWEIMRKRNDVVFLLLTKRPERVPECLPPGWGDGWDNIFLNVTCENYGGSRPCDFEWVKDLREECVKRNITFCFMETGTCFIKDGKEYRIRNKQLQNLQAYKSGMTFRGKKMVFELRDSFGQLIPKENLYVPQYVKKCDECSFRIICNGCSNCGGCEG